jgi:hypothetical protein
MNVLHADIRVVAKAGLARICNAYDIIQNRREIFERRNFGFDE